MSAAIGTSSAPIRSTLASPTSPAAGSKRFPSASVAEVRTAVRCSRIAPRIAPATLSGATWMLERPVACEWETETTSSSAGAPRRSQTSMISCRFARRLAGAGGPRRRVVTGVLGVGVGRAGLDPQLLDRIGEAVGQGTDHAAVGGELEGFAQLLRGIVEGRPGDAEPAQVAHGAAQHARVQDIGDGAGDAPGEVMRLVEDDHVVLGDDAVAVEGVDGQEGMVGDHDVHLAGELAAALGEAGLHHRAGPAQALGSRDGHLAPGTIGDRILQGVTISAVGLLRPLPQALDLVPQAFAARARRIGRGLGEQRAGVDVHRVPAVDLVPAEVVRTPLEQGEGGRARQVRGHRLDQARQVLAHDLGLQGDRRGGDHDWSAAHQGMAERGDQIGERLAGAGACLHEQVAASGHRRVDRLRHGLLAGARHAADRLDRRLHEGGQLDIGCPGGGLMIGGGGHRISVSAPDPMTPQAAPCSSAASASSTRAWSFVPSITCSSESTSPVVCARAIRSPRE